MRHPTLQKWIQATGMLGHISGKKILVFLCRAAWMNIKMGHASNYKAQEKLDAQRLLVSNSVSERNTLNVMWISIPCGVICLIVT